MADEVKPPASPGTAASLSVMRNVVLFVSGTIALWTVFSRGGLTEAYNYVNSIQGAPLLSSIAFLATFAWGPAKKWLDKKLIKQQAAAIEVAKTAAPEAAPVITAVAKGEVK